MSSFNALAQEIHTWARGKGFYDREEIAVETPFYGDGEARLKNPSLPAEKLALIHSEVSEALSALRDDDTEHEAEEVADIIIRVLDYSAWRGIDLDAAVGAKVEKNLGRPYLHGRAF